MTSDGIPYSEMERDLTPEWILKQTLSIQKQALTSYVNGKSANGSKSDGNGAKKVEGDLTLTVLGCGTMGMAILGGILDSVSHTGSRDHISPPGPAPSGTATPAERTPQRLPKRFNACVKRATSAKRIQEELGHYPAYESLKIYEDDNLTPTREADVVLLCCKPHMVCDLLEADGMRDALAGKLLISICAGVTEQSIALSLPSAKSGSPLCTIVRAMPNTAAAVRESMTVISISTPSLPPDTEQLVTWIFTRIGRVVHLPASNMDACTALCGSGPAFVALMVESMAAGAIAMGVPREESYIMAAQTMRGTSALLLGGEHPAILRDKVSTPGGCTIHGLNVLEEGGVRGTVAKAVRDAAAKAAQLGQHGNT